LDYLKVCIDVTAFEKYPNPALLSEEIAKCSKKLKLV
jgi:hypothetical protein